MFEPIKIISRKQILFSALKEAIFTGQLSPGDSLKELHLANQFDVSQAVVREALFQLEQVGLATKIPNKGTFVKKISENEIRERVLVRVCLEELACLRAVKKMQNNDFHQLAQYMTQMETAISQKQLLELTKIDLEFHQYIWKKSENEILCNTLTQIITPLFFISLNLQQIQHWTKITNILTMHENYLRALKSKNEGAIKKAISSHVKDTFELYNIPNISDN